MTSIPRPSILPAWAACACYDSQEEVGEAAHRGTLQHRALEGLLKGESAEEILRACDNLALELKIDDLTVEETQAVDWAREQIVTQADGKKIESEVKLYYYAEDSLEPLFEGTADAITGLDIFDLKTGRSHDYKWQMAAYAAMYMQRRPKLEEVNVHLLYSSNQKMVSMVFQRWKAEAMVNGILERRNDPAKKPTPCNFCGWCAHAKDCAALTDLAQMVGQGREDFVLEKFHASEISDPEQMAKALRLARFLKPWTEGVEHHAKELAIKQGLKIPGFAVVTRQGARGIQDVATAYAQSGLPIPEFLTCCTVQITPLEKKLGKKEFSTRLDSLVQRKPETAYLQEEKL